MNIFLFIVVVIFIWFQNNRISRLESQFKNKTVPQQATPVAHANASTDVTLPPITGTKPVTAEPKVSAEESSGRLLGRIGIGAVIVGVAFFLKYAYDNNWVNPAGRVFIGLLIGAGVITLGFYLRKKYLHYSDVLIGGGLTILYLSVFSSYALYNLANPVVAFAGMVLVTALAVGISIMNATPALSSIAFIGAFLAPLLVGVNDLGQMLVFVYTTILNVGILGILISKKWNRLILVGVVGTWLLFGTWYTASYTDAVLVPTLLFLLVQFLLFTAASVVRIIVQKAKATVTDYIVLVVTAWSFAGTVYGMLMPMYQHYVSIGSVCVAVFYGVIALIAFTENPKDRSINIFLPGLAVAFLTIAVPIEFTGQWIAAWWFVEALVLYIVASASSSRGFQIMGVVVYVLGLFSLFNYIIEYIVPVNYVIIFNGPFLMLAMAIGTAYIIAYMYYRYGAISPEIRLRGLAVFVVMANILTLYALTSEITTYYGLSSVIASIGSNVGNISNTMVSVLWALYAIILIAIGFIKRYTPARRMGLILFIVTAFKVVIDVWSIGELYRIISFIAFGIIALTASFLYAKYKDRLKGII